MINMLVVAHPDDEILGFGGTGAKIVNQGEIVQPIILCGNVDERSNQVGSDELHKNMIEANQLWDLTNLFWETSKYKDEYSGTY